MVEMNASNGRNSDNERRWLPVVAAAIRGSDGRWLMHRRPDDKHHGGLWEFPGGKVEPSEMPKESLVRELSEELGIGVAAADCEPAAFADGATDGTGKPIVILLYKIARYTGEPSAIEGGAIGWFDAEAIAGLDKPPLDVRLAALLFGHGEISPSGA